ncbi:MAG: hypothetical protein HC888_00860 [Candidatus Competibacteraceae bacterium]|nr:hypothetical protein [Candidatus Competibacteraceae bacterium]
MAVIPIVKEQYTEIVSDDTALFTAQCRASHGMEVFVGPSAPTIADNGILRRAIHDLVNRDFGQGKVYARVPSFAPYESTGVIVTPSTPDYSAHVQYVSNALFGDGTSLGGFWTPSLNVYEDSVGTIPASVDGVVGLVLNQAGGLPNAVQATLDQTNHISAARQRPIVIGLTVTSSQAHLSRPSAPHSVPRARLRSSIRSLVLSGVKHRQSPRHSILRRRLLIMAQSFDQSRTDCQ